MRRMEGGRDERLNCDSSSTLLFRLRRSAGKGDRYDDDTSTRQAHGAFRRQGDSAKREARSTYPEGMCGRCQRKVLSQEELWGSIRIVWS